MKMSIREKRLCALFKEVSNNYKEYGPFLKDYVAGSTKDPVKLIASPFMVAGSLITEGFDPFWSGVVDQKLQMPSGPFGRTRRDAAVLLKDVVTLHPLRAIGDLWRLATGDLIMDGADTFLGYHQGATRAKLSKNLNN